MVKNFAFLVGYGMLYMKYCIVGNFRMVQNFAVFTDRSATVK